jgi:excisionase family DNA binding protein
VCTPTVEKEDPKVATKMLLTIDEACELIGVKRSKLYELIASDSIESVRIGRARRIPADALEEYVARLRADARELAAG